MVLWAVSVCQVLCGGVSCCLAWLCCIVLLCWFMLRCAIWRSVVLSCVVCLVAVLLSRLALSSAVAGCCALCLGGVLCCPAELPVLGLLSLLVLCFWAPVVLWRLMCGAVPACLRGCFLCRALLPLWRWLLPCVVACCLWVFAVGSGCLLLSPGASWSRVLALLSLSGHVARCPVVWCGVYWCSAPLNCVL